MLTQEVPLYRLELVRERSIPFKKGGTTEQRIDILHNLLDRSPVEEFVVLYIDSDANVVGCERISSGNVNSVQVIITKIFRGAIAACVNKIVLGHNHPTGNATPSAEDIFVTEKAIEAGMLLKIDVMDHIIVCPDGSHTVMSEHPYITIE